MLVATHEMGFARKVGDHGTPEGSSDARGTSARGGSWRRSSSETRYHPYPARRLAISSRTTGTRSTGTSIAV
jgi:hypothetical protein